MQRTPDPSLLPVRYRTWADTLAYCKGNEEWALKTYIRDAAYRLANERVTRNAILDDERDTLCAYFDLGPISDLALKHQRLDYAFVLIRDHSFRAEVEAEVFGNARPAESYVPQVAA